MDVVDFASIRDELINNLRRRMLIPFIGSGFTRSCISSNGKVPSGDEYREFMLNEVVRRLNLTGEDEKSFRAESFSAVSSVYSRIIPWEERRIYLKANFTGVSIDETKKDFLSIEWPYVYTLNIDDAIENNSNYNFVIYSNRNVDNKIYDEEKCVIKLHGDISELRAFSDSQCEIFSQEQYINSLKNNTSLLGKLQHDMEFQNILYIGCSLKDEIDILSCALPTKDTLHSARYYCTTSVPSLVDRIKLERFGITHCVVFESYQAIYESIVDAYDDASKVMIDDLDHFKSFSTKKLSSSFEINSNFLLYGKSLIEKNREILVPYFFIQRDITDSIVKALKTTTIQFVIGSGCSGSSYVSIDIAQRIRDKDVYLFESKDRITSTAFSLLLERKNCIILSDCGALSISQIEEIIRKREDIEKNNTHLVIFAKKTDRDLPSRLKLLEINNVIRAQEIIPVELKNKLSDTEIAKINPRLTAIDAGVFHAEKTIVDNIIEIGGNLQKKTNLLPFILS